MKLNGKSGNVHSLQTNHEAGFSLRYTPEEENLVSVHTALTLRGGGGLVDQSYV